MHALAVVVGKDAVDEAIDALEEEGIYDDDRRIVEHDEGHVELPVTAAPSTGIGRVIHQVDPDRRVTDLDDRLRERGFTAEELEAVPNSWAVIGDVILVRLSGCPRPEEVAEALLDLHAAETVLDRHGVHGEHREPDVTVVAGSGDTETVHTEHGTKYALDLSRVMFSPGNKAERVRMGAVVEPDERVLDLFAGIGYFTLPMARAGASVTAVERNPVAFQYLLENAVLNDVADRVRPYRADCRDVLEWHGDPGIDVDVTADRVVMGYYDAHEYLDATLTALEPGGRLHLHEATPEPLVWDRPIGRLTDAVGAAGRTVEVLERRRVKTHSEGVVHVVIDARIE